MGHLCYPEYSRPQPGESGAGGSSRMLWVGRWLCPEGHGLKSKGERWYHAAQTLFKRPLKVFTQMISNQFVGANQTVQGSPFRSKGVAKGIDFDCLATSFAPYLLLPPCVGFWWEYQWYIGLFHYFLVLHVSLQKKPLIELHVDTYSNQQHQSTSLRISMT